MALISCAHGHLTTMELHGW